MGFDYQDLTQFEGVKATKRIGNAVVEFHISVERLWDMASNQTYTLSSDSMQAAVDDAGALKAQIACPNCRSTISIPVNGSVIDTPLTCQICGQPFAPHFYCPGGQAPSRHVFAATLLRVDNAGALYAFCPEHTFTTYSVAEDSKPRPKPTHLRSLARFFDSLVFRLTLNLEALRWQVSSKH